MENHGIKLEALAKVKPEKLGGVLVFFPVAPSKTERDRELNKGAL